MALEFPANPADGDVYPAAPNSEYVYNDAKGAWTSLPTESAKTITSDIAPVNAKDGDQWFNSIDGCLYIYYVDVDGGQWLQVKNDASFSTELGPTVDALNAGANTNYVINGAFDIWQRGTSFTTTANAAFTADRWLANVGAGATVVTSQQAFTPGTAPVAGYEGTYYCRVNRTVTGSAGSYFTHKVEDVRTLSNKTLTISFWAKASATMNIAAGEIYFWNVYGTGGSSATGHAINTATTVTTSWQRFSYTISMPSLSGKTIGANSYTEFAFYFPTSSSTFTFDIWGVQIQEGSKATNFHRAAPTLQGELAACQRYYQMVPANSITTYGNLIASNDNGRYLTIHLPVSMRSTITSGDTSLVSSSTVYFDRGTQNTVSMYWPLSAQTGWVYITSYSINKEL